MFCENCGKKLIRGYQFCIECGTPVPAGFGEEETGEEKQAEGIQAQDSQSEEMPGVQPLSSEEGTLVFCPTCGMRMQKSTTFCEKCGMKLSTGGSSGSSVPLVNSDPLGGDFGGISDSDIAQIDQFVNNTGFDGSGISYGDINDADALGGGNLNSEIEALNRQFANLNSTASEMPAISAPTREPQPVQPEPPAPTPEEPSLGTFARRVDDFSMEAGMPETQFMTESGLPVINGGEMTEPDVPVQLEQNYDDINIDVKEPAVPAYTEPVAEVPAYTEPVAEEPTYTEPVAEVPAYTEPVAEVPAYTEPVAEEPTYTEPVAEVPAYTEPVAEVPAYTEPVAEEPTYIEPAAEVPTYTEPAAEVPAYTEPVAEEPTYTEPAAEVPTYTEPVAEEPTYTEPDAEVPTYTEPVAEEPTYTEPAAEVPTYTEPAAEEPTYTQPAAEVPAYTQPEPAPIPLNRPAPAKTEEPESAEPDLGKLVYCRNCGQDMYEKEAVCKNCGSPNQWNVKPLRKSVSGGKTQQKKEPFKLFGVFTIPVIIGAAAVVAGIIALVVFTNVPKNSDSDIIDTSNTSSVTSDNKTSTEDPQNSEVASEPDDEPINPGIADSSDQSQPEESTPGNSSKPDESSDSSAPESDNTSEESSAPDVSKPDTSKPDESSSTPATTKTTTTAKTTVKPATTAVPVVSKPSATVSDEDSQRNKMLEAFEAISGEVGKLHLYAQATTYALEEGKTRSFFTSNMTKTLSSGKSTVASLYKGAEPSSAQFTSAYAGLEKLYNLYTDYYTYVTTSSDNASKYSSNEASKWDSFNNAVKNSFNYKILQTTNQTNADKSRTYAEIMSNASAAATNAVSQFTTVQTAVTSLKSSKYSSDVMATIYNTKASNILKASGYYQTVLNYYGILSSSVPSEYSSAKSSLSSLTSNLDELLGIFTTAGYNDLSGFKSECSSAISTANSSIKAVNNAL